MSVFNSILKDYVRGKKEDIKTLKAIKPKVESIDTSTEQENVEMLESSPTK